MKKNRKVNKKNEGKFLKEALENNAKIANKPVNPVLSEEQIKYFASLNKPETVFEPLKEQDRNTDPSIRGVGLDHTYENKLSEAFADKLNKLEELSNGAIQSYVDYKTLDLVFSTPMSQSIRVPLNLRNSITLILKGKYEKTSSRTIEKLLNSLSNDFADKQKLIELISSFDLNSEDVSVVVTKCYNKMQDVYSIYRKNSNYLLLEFQIDWIKNKLSKKKVPISKEEKQFIDSVFDGSLSDKGIM